MTSLAENTERGRCIAINEKCPESDELNVSCLDRRKKRRMCSIIGAVYDRPCDTIEHFSKFFSLNFQTIQLAYDNSLERQIHSSVWYQFYPWSKDQYISH